MKLQKIVSRLQELHPKEIDLSLDRIQSLCKKLGNPQDKIKAISIVGTNGKYSTIQAMFSILKEANFKCNIYTSPHIKSINERFVFNNEELNNEDLANLLEKIAFIVECLPLVPTTDIALILSCGFPNFSQRFLIRSKPRSIFSLGCFSSKRLRIF